MVTIVTIFPMRVFPSGALRMIGQTSCLSRSILEPTLPSASSLPPVKLVDSITELTALDAGCIAVTGSHAGLSSARFAHAARPLLSIFNDAGIGKDAAGIAGLDWLQAHGMAACAVAHTSACIGVAQSTWDHGVISHHNAAAQHLGIRTGQTCQRIIQILHHATEASS
jgi:hypothetical protein